MKNSELLKDLHIGRIIKEIASQKNISTKKIANVINRYQKNADKLFRLNDMDVEDIVLISYLFEYNILYLLSDKYLPHLPYSNNFISDKSCLLKIDLRNNNVTTYNSFNNSDFLKKPSRYNRLKYFH